jgi:hypothetical protein
VLTKFRSHANSVDKNEDGDYLLSARWTNAIYKISGRDGIVLWKLGGKRSSFIMEDFNLSRQHDAQWIEYDDEFEIISLLDNAADPDSQTADTSSALIIGLDKKSQPPVATVLSRIWRPDGKLSLQRGNYQRFANSGNTLASWSDNAYTSEHGEDGRLLGEVRFASNRFVTYRSYKFNFTGAPVEPPVVKSFAFGESKGTATTVVYVSWNGATEVVSWKFYAVGEEGGNVTIGSKEKTGFETMFQRTGFYGSVFAEGIDIHGRVLGRSKVDTITRPLHWAPGEMTETKPRTDKSEL